jgi:Fic family protein
MAIKKTELYTSLWASCDELRGGDGCLSVQELCADDASQDLLNNLFRHPYTKVEFVVSELGVSRITATKYLAELMEIGLLVKHKMGRENYYINVPVYELLSNVHQKTG